MLCLSELRNALYKGTFVEICREKGLSVPKQVRIPAKSSLEEVVKLVEEFSGNGHVYCKYSLGSLGMGTKNASFQYLGVAEPERVNPRCALEGEDGLMSMM